MGLPAYRIAGDSDDTLENVSSGGAPLSEAPALQAPQLVAPSGISARLDGDAIALADTQGRIVARLTADTIEIVADRRDLVLRAPSGRVHIEAALDVELKAGRDLTTAAGRDLQLQGSRAASLSASHSERAAYVKVEGDKAQVSARRLDLFAEHAHGALGVVSVLAKRIATRVDTLTTEARAHEISASSVAVKARDLLHEAAGSIETRAASARSIISGLFALHSERTTIVSKEETSVDGKKILLG